MPSEQENKQKKIFTMCPLRLTRRVLDQLKRGTQPFLERFAQLPL